MTKEMNQAHLSILARFSGRVSLVKKRSTRFGRPLGVLMRI
ncbi:hypothetical protein [Methanolobus sp.]|nr:hypothetical protein [Methanolobus sp.]